jgi:hypothetical protein
MMAVSKTMGISQMRRLDRMPWVQHGRDRVGISFSPDHSGRAALFHVHEVEENLDVVSVGQSGLRFLLGEAS